jgi:hypothetical protein
LRTLRAYPGKPKPIIYDFVDDLLGLAREEEGGRSGRNTITIQEARLVSEQVIGLIVRHGREKANGALAPFSHASG